ncbi:MAG: choice-of-anchor H family protein [Gammaproteobacteria bacterium]|nr:choice-of-anchor H family protein [Gammaproteobacteria bacterium]
MSNNTIIRKISLNISVLLIAILALPTITLAADSTSSKSISYSSNALMDDSTKDTQLKQAISTTLAPTLKQGYRSETEIPEKLTTTIAHYSVNAFNIYNVTTELISDFDYDGFYHRFSVEIDADTIYDVSYVYAKLYLSYEGGPWNYYATSSAYHIYGNSENDAFVIESELTDGFPSGYYDVRIELYDADYNEWLTSYGPYDDASISTLPLEDSYSDDSNIEIIHPVQTDVVVVGRGSMGIWLLLLSALVLTISRYKLTKKQKI